METDPRTIGNVTVRMGSEVWECGGIKILALESQTPAKTIHMVYAFWQQLHLSPVTHRWRVISTVACRCFMHQTTSLSLNWTIWLRRVEPEMCNTSKAITHGKWCTSCCYWQHVNFKYWCILGCMLFLYAVVPWIFCIFTCSCGNLNVISFDSLGKLTILWSA